MGRREPGAEDQRSRQNHTHEFSHMETVYEDSHPKVRGRPETPIRRDFPSNSWEGCHDYIAAGITPHAIRFPAFPVGSVVISSAFSWITIDPPFAITSL